MRCAAIGGSADEVNPPLPERRFASVVDADRARLGAVGERRQEVGNLAPASCPTRASRRTAHRPHASHTTVKNQALRDRLALIFACASERRRRNFLVEELQVLRDEVEVNKADIGIHEFLGNRPPHLTRRAPVRAPRSPITRRAQAQRGRSDEYLLGIVRVVEVEIGLPHR